MSEEGVQTGSPPRPVADAPVAALEAQSELLARSWLVALIEAQPLARSTSLPIADLTREGPELCAQLVRALGSDRELQRLCAGGDRADLVARVGRLAGAQDAATAVTAVEYLRRVLWAAALDELRRPSAALVADLSERLAYVCTIAAVAAARDGAAPVPATRVAGDEGPTAAPTAPESAAGPELAAGEGPAAWIGSIGRRLERFADDARPFAVLVIELYDADRLAQAEPAEELERVVAEVERTLAGELRPADVLSRESWGRYWLVTPETDREGALLLAERLAGAVESGARHRSVPLRVAIGAAVCPDDGRDAAELAAQADVGLYSARAAGHSVAPIDAG